MKRWSVALALSFIVSATHGQQNWSAPTDLLGLRFGESLAQQLPPCGGVAAFCLGQFKARGQAVRTGVNPPPLGFPYSLWLFEVGGRFEGAVIIAEQRYSSRLKDLAASRYGPPHKTETKRLVAGGAAFAGDVSEWAGGGVRVQWSQYGATAGETALLVVTQAYEADKAARRDPGKL